MTANTNYKYQAHLVSQDFNPLKTTLGNDDTTERDESQIYSNQGRPKQVRLAQKQPKVHVPPQAQDTESTISDDEQMVDQYELMQKQMQKIRESHGITANPKLMKPNLAYANMNDDDSSSDLSSDDDDIDGLDDDG